MFKHPVAMKTWFRHCFLVNFSMSTDKMRALLPADIIPYEFHGRAFLSVVIADMEAMRPAFLSKVFGVNYNQIVFRAVVQHQGEPGVYFFRSDADNSFMCWMGNLLTFFHFHRAHVFWQWREKEVGFSLTAKDDQTIDVAFDFGVDARRLTDGSAFADLKQASDALVELYTAFAPDGSGKVRRLTIARGEWDLRVVGTKDADFSYMGSQGPFRDADVRLDSVFYTKDLPYHWDRWK